MNKKKMYPRYFVIATVAVYLIFYIIPSILGLVYSFTDKTIPFCDRNEKYIFIYNNNHCF